MKIEKRTTCTITLTDSDAICDVTVNGSIEKDCLLGTIIRDTDDNPAVSYVCSHLIVRGGTAKGVIVRDGGTVTIDDGNIDIIRVEGGGRLVVNGGTITTIYESGGEVYGPFMKDKGTLSFEPYHHRWYNLRGDITIHDGNTFSDGDAWDARIVVFGGTIENYTLHHTAINTHENSTCKNLTLVDHSSLCISGGTIENVEVRDNSHIFLTPIVNQDGEYINLLEHVKNVNVRKSAWIELYCHEEEEIPSIEGLTIEDGVYIHTTLCDNDDVEHDTTKVYYKNNLLCVGEYNKITNDEETK